MRKDEICIYNYLCLLKHWDRYRCNLQVLVDAVQYRRYMFIINNKYPNIASKGPVNHHDYCLKLLINEF